MNRFAHVRTRLAIALAVTSCGTEAAPETIAGARALAKRDWQRVALRRLRQDNCGAGGKFRRCSDMDRDECDRTIAAALRTCIAASEHELPDSIAAGADDERLRVQLMGCMWHHAALALGPTRLDLACLLTPS